MCFVFVVTFSFLITDSREVSGASVGLAISQSMALTAMLQWGIRQSAEVMNQLMAVERVLEYRDLEKEEKEVKKVVDKAWPEKGNLRFNNVVYRYAPEMEPALRGVHFEVGSCEKIGIVGRTGVSSRYFSKKGNLLIVNLSRLENLH
jgi:ATP-binding cassette, subfamily C (CFTR/MRP), member 4